MCKVTINILQGTPGSVVTQTVLDWPVTKKLDILQLVISYSAYLPKSMTVGCQ